MKLFILIIILFATVSFNSFAHANDTEKRHCFTNNDLDDFNARWKISSTIGFEFGRVFCKMAYSDETNLCAARYAMDNSIKNLLQSYYAGTKACGSKISETCGNWCEIYIEDSFHCSEWCQLPNFKGAD